MKRIVTLSFIFFLTIMGATAQKIDYENSGKWFLGLNVGGTWQTSDIKNQTNVGYGFVLGKSFNYNYGKHFVFDLRARYLHGDWYGKDVDSTHFPINSAGDSIYGLNNFMSTQNRLALEFVIHGNRIRERTGFDPYIFGGIGLTWSDVWADYKNTIDTLSPSLTDGQYETHLTAPNKVSIMPSLGFGLGYQLGKRTTIGIEHKTTFTGYDLYDGLQSAIHTGNDMYHYTSFFINFRFKNRNGNTNGGSNTTGGGTNGSGNINNYNTSQGCISPAVAFIQPASTNTSATGQSTHISATIANVTNLNNVMFRVNGIVSTNFTFNLQTMRFDADVLLQQGANTFEVSATNMCGSDAKSITINYQPCLSPIVLYTDPVATNMSVSVSAYTVHADIYHVTDRNNILFTVNGIPNNAFSFDPQTGKFLATINLVENNNIIELSATTTCGKDVKSTTIIRKTCQMPVINVTTPATSSLTVKSASLPFSFKTQHVAAKQNVTVMVNGQNITSFTFNATTGVGAANAVLIPGVNTIVITSSNECGTDTETITVNYDNCVPPTLTITNPTMNNATFTNPQISLVALAQNITNQQGVSITMNGQSITNFTLNSANGQIQAGLNLNQGLNVIAVNVVNGCGTDIKTINVNYNPCVPPSIQITNPTMNGSTVNTPLFPLMGKFQNISNAQSITIQQNGRPLTGVTFNPQTGLFSANVTLNTGLNTFTISVVNGCGTASETVMINYTAPVNNTPQNITICHYPPGNNGNPQTIEIPLSAWPAHQAHGDVLGPCPVVNTPPCNPPSIQVTNPTQNGQTVNQTSFTIAANLSNISSNQGISYVMNGMPVSSFSYVNGAFSSTVNLANGWNTFILTATNACGSVTETVTVNYTAPVNNTPQKITICHYPPGNSGNPQTLEIPLASWPAHQAHGDVLGPCPTVNPTPPCNPPAIQVTNPYQNGQAVQQPAFNITANVTNIANNQGISCLVNGVSVTNFTLVNGSFSAMVNLSNGVNVIVLTAVNACGTDAETFTINYAQPVEQMITICHKTGNTSQTLEIPLSAWPAHQAHGDVLGTCPPVSNQNGNQENDDDDDDDDDDDGNNQQKVTICHKTGNTSQTIEIPLSAWPAHQAHGDILGPCPTVNPTPPCNPPSIQVTNPTQIGQTVQQTSFNITANISNVANNQGIMYTVNGKPFTGFSYSNGSFSNSVNLNPGMNTFTITATNDCGTDTETITINYSEPTQQTMTICHQGNRVQETLVIPVSDWPMHQAHGDVVGPCPTVNPTPPCTPPSIQVTNPTQNGITVQSPSFVIGATVVNVSSNQGVMMTLNGKPFTGFTFAPTKGGSLTSGLTLNPGMNIIVLTATNECGTDTETITINYAEPSQQTMTICHQGNRVQETLVIPVSDWPMHQAHGDVLGPCPTQAPNNGQQQGVQQHQQGGQQHPQGVEQQQQGGQQHQQGGQQHPQGVEQHQQNGSGGTHPVNPEIKPGGGKTETESVPKEGEENKEIKPGQSQLPGRGRG